MGDLSVKIQTPDYYVLCHRRALLLLLWRKNNQRIETFPICITPVLFSSIHAKLFLSNNISDTNNDSLWGDKKNQFITYKPSSNWIFLLWSFPIGQFFKRKSNEYSNIFRIQVIQIKRFLFPSKGKKIIQKNFIFYFNLF